MGFGFSSDKVTCLIVLVVCMLATTTCVVGARSITNRNMTEPGWPAENWGYGWFNHTRFNHTRPSPNTIVVGGSQGWHFGFNYSDWALKAAPIYLDDVLVFKYDPPSNVGSHSVYLLANFWSYLNCDFRGAIRVASPTQGAGDGFRFALDWWRPYYFACGENNGFHCNNGTMKFFVMPIFRH
ncbi:hypothetical protein Droror1_Dr00005850 [Drosera rotundifolia]